MKILPLYVTRSFYRTFFATVTVLTFIVSIGGLFKITDLLTKGIEAGPVLKVFLSGMPEAIAYAVPISAMTAALLVFGRLSGDSEVTAMRACGVSLTRVAVWLAPFAVGASMVCLYVNSELVPLRHYIRWQAKTTLKAGSAVQLLEVGRTVQIGENLRVFVGSLQEDGSLEDIRIFDEREQGRIREIKAQRGRLMEQEDGKDVLLELEQVTIDPFQFDSPGAAYSERWQVLLAQRTQETYRPRDKHQSFHDLYVNLRTFEVEAEALEMAAAKIERGKRLRQEAYIEAEAIRDRARGIPQGPEREQLLERALAHEEAVLPMVRVLQRQGRLVQRASDEPPGRLRARARNMRVVLNERLLLSLSPMLFLYFGFPMGIRPHRKESTIGIGMSLMVVFVFYITLMLMGELHEQPNVRPDLLVWVPGVVLAIVDVLLLRRIR